MWLENMYNPNENTVEETKPRIKTNLEISLALSSLPLPIWEDMNLVAAPGKPNTARITLIETKACKPLITPRSETVKDLAINIKSIPAEMLTIAFFNTR